jgi:hypothetical protein
MSLEHVADVVELRTPPPSLWLALPRKLLQRFVEGSTPRRCEHRSLGGAWRGSEEHQILVPVGGAGNERWVGAEVLLMTCFPSLLLTLLP